MDTREKDKLLLEGLAAEDKDSVEELYRSHFNPVKSMILAHGGDADDAADIFQETAIVLFQKVRSGQSELNCALKTYIYSVARRTWLKKLQQQQRFIAVSDESAETVPVDDDLDAHVKKQQDFNTMEAAMAKIGEPCHSLLTAYYLQKKHMNVIAEEFGYTNADNAKTQKYKYLVRLKKLFFAGYKNRD